MKFLRVFKRFILLLIIFPHLFVLKSNSTFASQLFEDKCNQSKDIKLEGSYLLGPGDLINIYFFGKKDFSGDFQVLPTGSIRIPFVGDVFVKDLTIDEAKKNIELSLSNVLLTSLVDITIKETRPISVSVIGEVKTPGIHNIYPKNFERDFLNNSPKSNEPFKKNYFQPKLTDALNFSGGITNKANLRSVCIKRRTSNSNNFVYKKINLISLIRNGEQRNNPYLMDEDIIYIGKIDENVKQDFFRNTTLDQDFIKINVVGEVNNPGQINVGNGTKLIDAIAAAGGIRDNTSSGYANIIRINDNGSMFNEKVKINFLRRKSSKEFNLRDGDNVYVSKSLFAKTFSSINFISEPILNILRILDISGMNSN